MGKQPFAIEELTPQGQASRAAILQAACSLLEEAPRLEVNAVASKASVSIGLLYRYFGSKDGLVAAVVHEFYDRFDDAVFLAPLMPEASWSERELIRISRQVDFAYDDPLGPAILGNRLREPAATAADAQRLEQHIDLAARNVQKGQRSGELDPDADPRLVAAAILGAFRSLVGEALARSTPPPRDLVVATAWRVGAATLLIDSSVVDLAGGDRP